MTQLSQNDLTFEILIMYYRTSINKQKKKTLKLKLKTLNTDKLQSVFKPKIPHKIIDLSANFHKMEF